MYLFHIPAWGACRIATNTSGKHGFGLPKLFRISSCDGRFGATFTLRFKNRLGHCGASERNNCELIRVAIAQFCAWQGDHERDCEEELDTSLPPYAGEVSNRHGQVLSHTSLLPRQRGRQQQDSGHSGCSGAAC